MKNKKKIEHLILGCVADDFTGASDAASFLAEQGIKTMLFNGIPKKAADVKGCAAVVIALKTRSIPAKQAVQESLQAFDWLRQQGAQQLYFKYCSTFDSTPTGNIGTVADAVLERYGFKYTLLCPSLPVNKRIVKDGVLYVDGKPIAEGHMANHPLNPIWNSNIDELMKPQSRYSCLVMDKKQMNNADEDIMCSIKSFGENKEHFYIIPDYADDADGKRIDEIFCRLPFVTGGSGFLAHIANRIKSEYDCIAQEKYMERINGKGIALSGSCSKMTCRQCSTYAGHGKTKAVYPKELLNGNTTVNVLYDFVKSHESDKVLIYSAGATDPNSRIYKDDAEAKAASSMLEQTMAAVAKKAYADGYNCIVVAGGETSGAVALALGFDSFIIGKSVAPGVPVMIPAENTNVRLVLKSGNFGQEDFFDKAFRMIVA